MRIAVVGASGYTGLEALRILRRHPECEIAAATSEQKAGQAVGEAFPALRGLVDLAFEPLDAEALGSRVDGAIVCLPHATAAPAVAGLRKGGARVVDLSADFRFEELALYEEWYGPHGAPELFGQGVYGLPELYREALGGAALAAAAGCYPTAALLPMVPFLRAGVVEPSGIIVDAKSGVSGAGRKLADSYLFSEQDENCMAYAVAAHRHGPEIEQEAARAAGEAASVTFVPHLLPTIRGIVASAYLRLRRPLDGQAAREILLQAYADEPFVRVLPQGETPRLGSVRGSNYCDVAVVVHEATGTLVALSALDNLVKGASGQGVQCLNLMMGWDETLGLEEAPLHP
ncbi:MAG: N-acetyl-gamma-glutamyl-phosphate reductase [Deltaproteobacteria bacterium]|jgi:N-acetyl-gamma-glutamyl-phosphate reductase|nr:N-acetyl-gamma-glutamyl-phosphate reductase [Deltaproteobacteria bacterium]